MFLLFFKICRKLKKLLKYIFVELKIQTFEKNAFCIKIYFLLAYYYAFFQNLELILQKSSFW